MNEPPPLNTFHPILQANKQQLGTTLPGQKRQNRDDRSRKQPRWGMRNMECRKQKCTSTKINDDWEDNELITTEVPVKRAVYGFPHRLSGSNILKLMHLFAYWTPDPEKASLRPYQNEDPALLLFLDFGITSTRWKQNINKRRDTGSPDKLCLCPSFSAVSADPFLALSLSALRVHSITPWIPKLALLFDRLATDVLFSFHFLLTTRKLLHLPFIFMYDRGAWMWSSK